MREGWISDNLSNCIKLKSGDGLTAKKMISGEYPVFGGNGIAGYHNDFNLSGENIVIGRVGALCGNSRYVNKKIWLTDNAFKISEFKYEFDLEFLNYLLNNVDLRSYARQAAQPVISNSSLKNVILSFPKSLSEQKQIVKILDEAFTAIDQAKANIEKNIQNAKELFDSKKEVLFEKLALEYEPRAITEACLKIFAGGDAPKDDYSKEKTEEFNIPIIANAVKNNGLYGYTNEARVTKPSITIAARGSGTGHTEYRDYHFLPIVRLIVLIPDSSLVEVEFLMYAIKTLTILRSGSAIPQLTVPMIKGYSIPIPNLDVQIQIVAILNDLDFKLQSYTSKFKNKLSDLEELKKSILQKAFAGELTNKMVEV